MSIGGGNEKATNFLIRVKGKLSSVKSILQLKKESELIV